MLVCITKARSLYWRCTIVPIAQQKPVRVALVIGLLLVMALQLVHMTRVDSATWDEPHHLFDGYTVWTKHDYRLNPEVPPLVKLTAALPLLGRHLQVPINRGRSVPTEAFLDGRSFVFDNGANRTLAPARLACMALTLLLGLLLYLAGAEMFGYGAGLFALALFAFDPNFLAHGALVTTDAGSACFFLAAVYTFYRYCKRSSWQRLLLAGVAAGVLLAAKFTGIFLFPMLLCLVVLEAWAARSGKVLRHRLAGLLLMAVCAWVVLWSFYGFRYKAAPDGGELNPTLRTYLGQMVDRGDASRLSTLVRFHALPEAYLWGLENTKNTEFEDTSYFWGRVCRHGNWKYFPVAFLVKSTLPLLLLLGLSGFVFSQRCRDRRREFAFLLVPVVVYFAISMHSDMDIGVRHVLPVYAFLYVLAGGCALMLARRNVRWTWVLGVLLLWQIVTSARVAPAYMAYGNEAWGGPSQVHRYLSDANTDWGQQLLSVKDYLAAHPAKECWFAYFPDGAIQSADYGVNCHRLPTTNSLHWLDLQMDVPPVIEGTVLISDSDLEGIEFGDGSLNPYDSFRGRTPDTVIQHGVYVYQGRFAVPLASALIQAHNAGKLLKAGSVKKARASAEAAAALAPGSAYVQSELADILAADGDRRAAADHYATALQCAQKVRPDLQASYLAELPKKIAALQTDR